MNRVSHDCVRNPFATRFVRPGAARFRFDNESTTESLIRRWVHLGRRGTIRGPHGVGKTTLLFKLADRIESAGHPIVVVRAATEKIALSGPAAPEEQQKVVAIDGFEQWPRRKRSHWLRWSRDSNHGLIATTHRVGRLPCLVNLQPRPALFRAIASKLIEHHFDSISEPVRRWRQRWPSGRLDRLLHDHRGNYREALFALYDDWEDNLTSD